MANKYLNSKVAFLLILITGIALRIFNFAHNPGLWLDEALLALNLTDKSYLELLLPLDHNQVAPVLFLLTEKLSISIFGPVEASMRLFPLICSVFSLPVFYLLSKDLLRDEKAALAAFLIFSLAPLQIRYSAEVKQYMTDVFVILLLFWLFNRCLKEPQNKKLLFLLAISGIIGIFLSNISVFVLFTLAVYWLIKDHPFKREGLPRLIVLTAWFITFGTYYYLFIAGHKNEGMMLSTWADNFMPLNPFSIKFWNFFNTIGRKVFFEFLIYNQAGLAQATNFIIIFSFLILYVAGLMIMVLRRERAMVYFLAFPILLHLILSGIRIYPFETRLALYLSPLIIMVFSYGLIQLKLLSEKVLKVRWPGILALISVFAVFSFKLFVNYPVEVDGVRESIGFINENYRDGQHVYVYYYSNAPVEYYKKTKGIKFGKDLIPGTGEGGTANWKADLDKLVDSEGETWLLFSHLFSDQNTKDRPDQIIVDSLMQKGQLVKSHQVKNSSAYLFRL